MSGQGPNPGRPRPHMSDAKGDVRQDAIDAKTLPIAGGILVPSGKHKGQDFRLREGNTTVGPRPDGEIVLTDAQVSQKHATITVRRGTDTAGNYSVVDLDSTNGTFLNENSEKIVKAELVDNDVI